MMYAHTCANVRTHGCICTQVYMLALTLLFPATASVMVSLFLCCDLNVKCPPRAPVFERLVYNRQSCFGRLWKLEDEMVVGWALKLASLAVFPAHVPLPGSSHNAASHLRYTVTPCHDGMNP